MTSKIKFYTKGNSPNSTSHGAQNAMFMFCAVLSKKSIKAAESQRQRIITTMYARVLALAGLVATATAFAPAALPMRAPRKFPTFF